MRGPQGYEWLIILAIVLVLFGGRKLPDLARSVGRSMRIFRSEVNDGQEGSGTGGRGVGARALLTVLDLRAEDPHGTADAACEVGQLLPTKQHEHDGQDDQPLITLWTPHRALLGRIASRYLPGSVPSAKRRQ